MILHNVNLLLWSHPIDILANTWLLLLLRPYPLYLWPYTYTWHTLTTNWLISDEYVINPYTQLWVTAHIRTYRCTYWARYMHIQCINITSTLVSWYASCPQLLVDNLHKWNQDSTFQVTTTILKLLMPAGHRPIYMCRNETKWTVQLVGYAIM